MKKRNWMILGVVLLGIVMRVPITSIPAILTDIAESYQVSVSSLGILTSLPLLMFALFSSIVPKAAEGLGLERLVALTLLIMGVGSVLRIFQLPGLFIGTILVGIGIAVVNVVLPSIVSRYFPTKIGLYTTLYTTVMGISITLFTSFAVPFSSHFSWQGFILLLSAVIGGSFILWLPNLMRVSLSSGEKHKAEKKESLLKNKAAVMLLVFGGLQFLLFYTELAWLPTISQAFGFSKDESGSLLGMYNLVSIPISLIIPGLITQLSKNGRINLVVGLSFLTIIGLLILFFTPANYLLWAIGHICLGISAAALFPYTLVSFTLKTNNAQDTARLSGMVQAGGYLLAAVGPIILGYSNSLLGSWKPFLVILGVIPLVMIWALYQLEKVDKIIE